MSEPWDRVEFDPATEASGKTVEGVSVTLLVKEDYWSLAWSINVGATNAPLSVIDEMADRVAVAIAEELRRHWDVEYTPDGEEPTR